MKTTQNAQHSPIHTHRHQWRMLAFRMHDRCLYKYVHAEPMRIFPARSTFQLTIEPYTFNIYNTTNVVLVIWQRPHSIPIPSMHIPLTHSHRVTPGNERACARSNIHSIHVNSFYSCENANKIKFQFMHSIYRFLIQVETRSIINRQLHLSLILLWNFNIFQIEKWKIQRIFNDKSFTEHKNIHLNSLP